MQAERSCSKQGTEPSQNTRKMPLLLAFFAHFGLFLPVPTLDREVGTSASCCQTAYLDSLFLLFPLFLPVYVNTRARVYVCGKQVGTVGTVGTRLLNQSLAVFPLREMFPLEVGTGGL